MRIPSRRNSANTSLNAAWCCPWQYDQYWETLEALVLTILWADNQTIDDALLHALMDDFGSAISH